MKLTITSLKEWDSIATRKEITRIYGKKAGKLFSKCMLKLARKAEKTNLLQEMDDPRALMSIRVKEDGTPTIITMGFNYTHCYTFKNNLGILILDHKKDKIPY